MWGSSSFGLLTALLLTSFARHFRFFFLFSFLFSIRALFVHVPNLWRECSHRVGRADVTIQNSEPARIEIDPASLRTTVGSLDLLVATVYDTEGVEIEGATVEW